MFANKAKLFLVKGYRYSYFLTYRFCTNLASQISNFDHPVGEKGEDHPVEIYSDDQLTTIVEAVLTNMDTNKDGFINWREYRQSNSGK